MIQMDFSDKTVLITGGTKGIGRATGLLFAQAGARTVLTYKWGSADMNALTAEYAATGGPEPILVQADVSVEEDTNAVMAEIGKVAKTVDVFVSNVGFAATTPDLKAYKKRSLFKTLEYSTWPMIDYTVAIQRAFGAYPKHVIGVSSDGPDHYYRGYDFVAASKALLEFFGKYLSVHLFKEGGRVNVIRFGTVKTESFADIFGEKFFDYALSHGATPEMILSPEECANAIFAVASGLLDGMNGQLITVDKGLPLIDNLMMRYLDDQQFKE